MIDWADEMPLGDDNVNDGSATDYDFPYGMDLLRKYVPLLPNLIICEKINA